MSLLQPPPRFIAKLPRLVIICLVAGPTLLALEPNLFSANAKPAGSFRIATFNASMHRPRAGDLIQNLESPDHAAAKKVAQIIQIVRPDILLLNEFDYDGQHRAADLFAENYLGRSQNGLRPIRYGCRFLSASNTGIDSGLDLDRNGNTGEPADAFGFGSFPGQYGMLLLSELPINLEQVRTFQFFLWKDMPGARVPRQPRTGKPFFESPVWRRLRLSSKSHWDIPIKAAGNTLHILACHPTPPVFDGAEDLNGNRNHDEIRLFADYIEPAESDYIYDDRGRRGGLKPGSHFVIAGDLNADPHDGQSQHSAVRRLINHRLIHARPIPASQGAVEQAIRQARANRSHRGNPAHDTADFEDYTVGNLRADYLLPSRSMTVVGCGVYWPSSGEAGHELLDASDHRLVWIDVTLKDSR